jgi:hypothetical protein
MSICNGYTVSGYPHNSLDNIVYNCGGNVEIDKKLDNMSIHGVLNSVCTCANIG